MASVFTDFFSIDDISYIKHLPEVINAKPQTDPVVKFYISLTPSIASTIESKFGINMSNVTQIPMRWIKGDTIPHIDRGDTTFKNTHLVYIDDNRGDLILDGISYPIMANTGFVFKEGIEHETRNTGDLPRLLLGPMDELASPVGNPAPPPFSSPPYPLIVYYNNYSDAYEMGGNYIALNYYDSILGNIHWGSIGNHTYWKVASIYPEGSVEIPTDYFYNGFDLSVFNGVYQDILYYVYPYTPHFKPSLIISSSGHKYGFDSASDTFQQPLIQWKGKTFSQVFASLQKNSNSFNTTNPSILRRALPLKIYRKEFASRPFTTGSQYQRKAVKIDDMNAPNGYSVSIEPNPDENNGVLTATLDINYENNRTQHPNTCVASTGTPCMNPENDARKRVRSAGMYRKKFNKNRNNDSTYHSSSRDYLVSRNKTFEQNQYQFLRNGDRTHKPGQTELSFKNDYSAQGIQHCVYYGDLSTVPLSQSPHKVVTYKPNNWRFSTQGAVDSSGLTSLRQNQCRAACMNYPKKNIPFQQSCETSYRRAIS